MIYKLKALLAVMFSVLTLSAVMPAAHALASCPTASDRSFFTLIPTWYEYLQTDEVDGSCVVSKFDIPGDVWKILLAVVDIILRIAGVVAVVFVIRAGFAYVLSRGNPSEAAKARQMIIDALIGVGIASIATVLVAFLGTVLTRTSA